MVDMEADKFQASHLNPIKQAQSTCRQASLVLASHSMTTVGRL